MTATAVEATRIVDSDTHITEPADLWTSRISTKKWGDLVPHTKWDPERGVETWFIGDTKLLPATLGAHAGWKEFTPDIPPSLDEILEAARDQTARVEWMDENGIQSQVLYPNVQGFGTGNVLRTTQPPELMLECVRAYNDYLTEYAAAVPGRFIPVMALPFWDMDATLVEMERCVEAGHLGITFSQQPDIYGLPQLTDPNWEPLWAACAEMDLSVNFHIGSGDTTKYMTAWPGMGRRALYNVTGAFFMISNVKTMSELIHAGICHRYPTVKFVSVESAIGWIPWFLAQMDYTWKQAKVFVDHPEYDLLPSEYFLRQMYATFWYETDTALDAIARLGADNFLFQTDFPHPMCLCPGEGSIATGPKEHLQAHFSHLPDETLRKIMHDNAAEIYHQND